VNDAGRRKLAFCGVCADVPAACKAHGPEQGTAHRTHRCTQISGFGFRVSGLWSLVSRYFAEGEAPLPVVRIDWLL
jgi:hypothetical protein